MPDSRRWRQVKGGIMKLFHFAIITIISASIITGCSSYGKIIIESKNKDDVAVEKLIKNSDDYDIHYFGHGKKFVSGIIFDPKRDNKKLIPSDRWVEINEQPTVSDIVQRIKDSNHLGFSPTFYRIVGPNGGFYGYLFTGWLHIVFKKIDDDALSVYGLDDPPEYLDGGPSVKSMKL
jgi:hypothetical protein